MLYPRRGTARRPAPAPRWSIAGHATRNVNARDVVTGRHRYPSDMTLPDMLYGKVLRPPSIGATLGRVDTSGAAAVPGVGVAHAGRLPHVSLEADAGTQPVLGSDVALLNNGTGSGAQVLLSVSLPLWDFGIYSGRVAEARAGLDRAVEVFK